MSITKQKQKNITFLDSKFMQEFLSFEVKYLFRLIMTKSIKITTKRPNCIWILTASFTKRSSIKKGHLSEQGQHINFKDLSAKLAVKKYGVVKLDVDICT